MKETGLTGERYLPCQSWCSDRTKQGGVRPVVVFRTMSATFIRRRLRLLLDNEDTKEKKPADTIISFGRQKGWQDLRWYWRSSLIHVIRPV